MLKTMLGVGIEPTFTSPGQAMVIYVIEGISVGLSELTLPKILAVQT